MGFVYFPVCVIFIYMTLLVEISKHFIFIYMMTLIIVLLVFGVILYLYHTIYNRPKKDKIPPLSEEERERQRGLVDPEPDGLWDIDKVEPRDDREPIESFIERELEQTVPMNKKDIQKKVDIVIDTIETVQEDITKIVKDVVKPKRTYKKKPKE
jgi:Ca2+/Na+ antiporter